MQVTPNSELLWILRYSVYRDGNYLLGASILSVQRQASRLRRHLTYKQSDMYTEKECVT